MAENTIAISPDHSPEFARSFEHSTANMPMSLEAPVLQVDANVIHKVDTTNPANLFSMWTGELLRFPLKAAYYLLTVFIKSSQGVGTQWLKVDG